jgi:hypothetical protein
LQTAPERSSPQADTAELAACSHVQISAQVCTDLTSFQVNC